jgi:putative sterol carrier protein
VELDVFTQAWAEAWARELNASAAYRAAAADWEDAVALVLDDPDPAARRAVMLDLWHGQCRSAGTANPDDLSNAGYVFEANRAGWKQVLADGGSPVMALMTGKVRLAKGTLLGLMPFAAAAKELLVLAGAVPGRFPEDLPNADPPLDVSS